jgi:Dolichyl-phosphate-mannose-protein mannosyltransferase
VPFPNLIALRLLVWSVLLFACAFFLNTQHNRFPYHYHPDEPGKVEQIMEEEWNFHHPLLLLTVTNAAVHALKIERDEQRIVEVGRCVSAAFASVAVVALSLLAFLWRGWSGAILTGAALALHHQLFELSHYMKEDTALLMGVALTFLAAGYHERRPSSWGAIFLGIAAGLAIAGKYLGVITVLIAIPVLWAAPPERRWPRVMAFGIALAATFALVNLPLFANVDTFRHSLDREVDLVVRGQGGMTRSVPHWQYWNVFIDNTTPVMWVLIAVFLVARWRERGSISRAQWLVFAFPFLYAIALSFSPKSNDRYFIPATGAFTLLAALGVEDTVRLLAHRFHYYTALVAVGVFFIAAQLPSWWKYEIAFLHDDTADLIEWLRAGKDVPKNAVIAKDNRVGLPDPAKKKHAARVGIVPQRVVGAKFAADLGSIQSLRDSGVTHVAVSESDYGKFFLKSLRPQRDEAEDFERRRQFYEELLRADPPIRLLFERERGTVIYLHPGIRVYRLGTL